MLVYQSACKLYIQPAWLQALLLYWLQVLAWKSAICYISSWPWLQAQLAQQLQHPLPLWLQALAQYLQTKRYAFSYIVYKKSCRTFCLFSMTSLLGHNLELYMNFTVMNVQVSQVFITVRLYCIFKKLCLLSMNKVAVRHCPVNDQNISSWKMMENQITLYQPDLTSTEQCNHTNHFKLCHACHMVIKTLMAYYYLENRIKFI